jgi:hypothetical protein
MNQGRLLYNCKQCRVVFSGTGSGKPVQEFYSYVGTAFSQNKGILEQYN